MSRATPPLCVLGLGLIGGSLLRAVGAGSSPAPVRFGWSPSEETRQAAADDGHDVVSTLDAALVRALREDALVVLAAPLTAFDALLQRIGQATPTIRLTDVASVKQPVAERVEALAPRTRYVGSHPMAGTAASGWAAGSADLFRNAAWVTSLTDETDVADWVPIADLALSVGARVVPADGAAHDAAVARISHLPHVLALALAQTGRLGGSLALSLAAGSFADGTRVAATRPALVRAMCEANSDALIDALDDALALLGVARASLASTGSLAKLTATGHQARSVFERRFDDLTPTVLDGVDLIEQLFAVGASGGYVTAVHGKGADLTIDALVPAPSA